jgi:cell wall-associated NlpC family hydrolase
MARGLDFGKLWIALLITLLLGACAGPTALRQEASDERVSDRANDVVLTALGLVDTQYRFGGKDPEAGFDCSGMVSYVYREAAGIKLEGSAAAMARRGNEIERQNLRPGDLVFFNTLGRPFSHVGIYIGDGRYVHAPSSKGKVRIDRMDNTYWAKRFEVARSYLD